MASNRIPTNRVFVDSSVLIAAVLSPTGSARDLILLGREGRIALIVSSLVVTEVARNIERKSPDKLSRLQRILDTCPLEIVEPTKELVASESTQIELKDAPIVAAAAASDVKFLVTYDAKHLLAEATRIEARHGLIVCSPAVAIASLVDSE